MALFRAATLLTAVTATAVAAGAGDCNTPRTAGAAQPSPEGVGLLSTPWLRDVAEADHYGASMLTSAPWVRSSAAVVGSLVKVASPPPGAGAADDASSSKLEDIASLLLSSPWARSTEKNKGGVRSSGGGGAFEGMLGSAPWTIDDSAPVSQQQQQVVGSRPCWSGISDTDNKQVFLNGPQQKLN